MQKNISCWACVITLLLSLILFSCGGKKSSEVTAEPAEKPVDCALWEKNRGIITASYSIAQSKGDKIYINKLSIEQLVNTINLDSDPRLLKIREQLLDSLDHAPHNNDPLYTIEFTQPAIALRDKLVLGVVKYLEKCPQ
ncbi:MAG TPA: hypothetical protein VFV79_03045 [Saprospiraceae bacterium]|nr:hypothetical protein [Saprospiraceae bacterium]